MIFRRNTTQIRALGGLWDASQNLYAGIPFKTSNQFYYPHPREHQLEWEFPTKMTVRFAHLEYEKTVLAYQGSEIPLLGFDELCHFTQKQFFYMLSRNRSMSGVPGRVRATCNPDADSWVRDFISWWIGADGTPIKERSGKIRWFIRIEDSLIWADSKKALVDHYGPDCMPKSMTFIASNIFDNKILLEKDPGYLANLKSLSRIDRLRLLGGNWNIRATAGTMFRREWFPIVDAIPAGWHSAIRFWDRSATKPHEGNPDPDWTRGLKVFKYPDDSFIVADLKSVRDTPWQVENLVKNVAGHDSNRVQIMSQQDPGSAGVVEAMNFVRMLIGYDARTVVISKDKVTRAKPVSAQAEVGNIRVLRAPWNDEFFTELENFPDGRHDDIVDCLSGAFNALATGYSIMDVVHKL